MSEGTDLWKKYCGFFELDFAKQMEYNQKKKDEHFQRWKNTNMAKKLCSKREIAFEDVPLTTYHDYPILQEFGEEVQQMAKKIPKIKDELMWDYYKRISRKVSPMLDGWMPDKYYFCFKTSGTGGGSKWVAHGERFWNKCYLDINAVAILSASENWGETKLKRGDRMLNMMPPAPYGGSCVPIGLNNTFELDPPILLSDNISDMRKKFKIYLKIIQNKKIDFTCCLPSILSLIAKYLTNPADFFKDRYESMDRGFPKFILGRMYTKAKKQEVKYHKVKEIMPLKGLFTGATDPKFYLDEIKDQYGITPLNCYASSEGLAVMFGSVDKREYLLPILRSIYFEFLIKNGDVKKVDELKKGEVYELVISPFWAMQIRYKTDDMFRVIDFQDGLPVLSFEGREKGMFDIYGYYWLSEAMIVKAFKRIGLKPTDNWAVLKETEPREHICFLMEKPWEHSEEKTVKLLVDSLRKINPDLNNYITDFKIKDISNIMKVKYLRKGSFMRYRNRKMGEGTPMGQLKPPTMIPPEQAEVAKILEEI
jgi:hypothetical protein